MTGDGPRKLQLMIVACGSRSPDADDVADVGDEKSWERAPSEKPALIFGVCGEITGGRSALSFTTAEPARILDLPK